MTMKPSGSPGKFTPFLIGLIVILLGFGATFWNRSEAASVHDMPTLSGDAAVDELKRQGLLDSLMAAMEDSGIRNDADVSDVEAVATLGQQAYLKASNTGAIDFFGHAVAVSGDTVVVTARREASSTTGVNSIPNDLASGSGAAYVFTHTLGVWSQQAYLKASNTGAEDFFGHAVSVSGDTIVIGAPGEDSNTTGVNSTPNDLASGAGAAYVFTRTLGVWAQEAYLKALNTGAGDNFGSSVSVSGNTIVIGAPYEASSTTGVNSTPNELASNSGAAYVFTRSSGDWSQQAYLKASNTGANDLFGDSVAVSGDTVVVGAPYEDSNTTGVNSTPNDLANGSGAAYVFTRTAGAWSQQAYLKASNTGAEDFFGLESVAVSGDTVVVGAPYEDSNTTGVNSTPNDLANDSGAAYVFTRTAGAWSQQAYLKASNTGVLDLFGDSVAVSGDMVVVGARGEDSSTTGVNSTPNNSANNSGAAYVFTLTAGVWSQQAYLKASNTGAVDSFGDSVAVSGDTVVVGAPLEDSSTTGVNSTPDDLAINAGAAYIFDSQGGPAPTPTPTPTPSSTIQFISPIFSSPENNISRPEGIPLGPIANITVTRTGTVGTSTVQAMTADGTATGGESCTAGVDYINSSAILTFNDGVASQLFQIQICDDDLVEGNETINLGLSMPTGATIGTPGSAVLTIIDNDFVTATPTPTPAPSPSPSPGGGLEGDLASRPNGDGSLLSNDVTLARQFVVGLLVPTEGSNEFQRADTAPLATRGDGILTAGDVTQIRRYVAGIDPTNPAGGPTGTARPESTVGGILEDIYSYFFGREMRVASLDTDEKGRVNVAIEFRPYGDEVAASFTLEYDATLLSNPQIVLSEAAPEGAVLTVNTNEVGKIGILVDSTEAFEASAVPKRLLIVTFDVVRGASGETAIALTDSLAHKGTADANGNTMRVRYLDGVIKLPRE